MNSKGLSNKTVIFRPRWHAVLGGFCPGEEFLPGDIMCGGFIYLHALMTLCGGSMADRDSQTNGELQ